MDRRTFLLGALALVGCAQSRPALPSATPTPSAASLASPATPAVVVGADQTATGTMLGALLTGAVAASGIATLKSDWQAVLDAGTVSAAPLYAGTTWALLSDADEPSDDVVSDLAGLVEPDVSVMSAGRLDGALVWMGPASSTLKSLAQVKSLKSRTVAVPSLAVERSDGLPGLAVIYQAKGSHVVEDDPVARAALVASGRAAFGAFRRTDYLGTDQLVELDDPSGMSETDPIVLVVNATFADADPKAVLALNAVLQALTDADLVDLQQQTASGMPADQVAHAWLAAKGLAA